MWKRATLALLLGVAGFEASASEPLSLHAIFEGGILVSSSPEGIQWRPDGRSVLYRRPAGRWTELVRQDAVTGEREVVADWTRLMGQLSGQRPDFAAAVRDDVNRAGRFADDPMLSPDGHLFAGSLSGDLYVVDWSEHQARFVTDGPEAESSFEFSPDGSRLGFVRAGDLYTVQIDGQIDGQIDAQITTPAPDAMRTPVRLTDNGEKRTLQSGLADWLYDEELELSQAYWWSPDSGTIAYLQFDTSPIPLVSIGEGSGSGPGGAERQFFPLAGEANARVRLGVVSAQGGATTWLVACEKDCYIPRVGWSSDGRLWYEWLARDQKRLELRVVEIDVELDPAHGDGEGLGAGTTRTLVVERDPAWINILGTGPLWVGPSRFVWASERDGWRHLYLYSHDGRLIRRLTEGQWQVENVYGSDDRSVFFQATREHPRERHIYRVPLEGGSVTRLSRDAGTHDAILAPGGRYLLDLWSSAAAPPQVRVLESSGKAVRTLDEGARLALAKYLPLPVVEFGRVVAEDGQILDTKTVRPPAFDPQLRYPVLVYVYGGPRVQAVRDIWDGQRQLFFQFLAQQGLVVFSVDGRGAWGRGHAFESVIHRQFGQHELADQVHAVRWLQEQSWVAPDRIGIYGASFGGFMVLEALSRAPRLFRAGVAHAPVTDWSLYDTAYTERYMERPQENPLGYRSSAALERAENLRRPLLLLHGSSDNNVHLRHSQSFVNAVGAEGVVEFVVMPGVRHSVLSSGYALEYHRRVADFLLERLVTP